MIKRIEHASSNEIEFALRDYDEVYCKFVTFNQGEGEYYLGYVHMALPNYKFLVSDSATQIAYVVSFRDIKHIEYEESTD